MVSALLFKYVLHMASIEKDGQARPCFSKFIICTSMVPVLQHITGELILRVLSSVPDVPHYTINTERN